MSAHNKLPISSAVLVAWLETACVPLLNNPHLHPIYLSAHLFFDAFYKSSFFSHYVMLLYDDDRMQ